MVRQAFSLKPELNLTQTTVLAPQLQQGVKMLQLSSAELQDKIDRALESNPFLERMEIDAGFGMQAEREVPGADTVEPRRQHSNSAAIHGTVAQPAFFRNAKVGSTAGRHSDQVVRSAPDPFVDAADTPTLHGYLRDQANATPLTDKQHIILELLIDCINDKGYLRASTDEIIQLAMPDYVINRQDVTQAIDVLQGFEPAGVGARNPGECLLLQLEEKPVDTPGLDLAKRVVSGQLHALAKQDYLQIARELEVSQEALQQSVALIRQLNPFPGLAISSFREETVVADLMVKKLNGRWVVRLNPNVSPAISIHHESADLLKLARGQSGYRKLKQTLQDAQVLINNIENRYRTLFRVATLIVELQQDYLEKGELGLKPLTQKELADTLELHVSTVSRAVNEKFIQTPSGIVELGSFFCSAIQRSGGGSISSRAIQERIRKLIEQEPSEKPLSDNKITEILVSQGIQIARRTVMKYRVQLGVPASPKRRKRQGKL